MTARDLFRSSLCIFPQRSGIFIVADSPGHEEYTSRSDRQNAREIIGADSFAEIYVSTPLEECEKKM